jgi:hypothetical protein
MDRLREAQTAPLEEEKKKRIAAAEDADWLPTIARRRLK